MSAELRFLLEGWIALGLALAAIWLGVLAVAEALLPPRPEEPSTAGLTSDRLDRTLTEPASNLRGPRAASMLSTSEPRSTMPDQSQTSTKGTWEPYPGVATQTPASHERPHAGRHGGKSAHTWMMLLMCVPLVAIGLWQFGSGRGLSSLLAGLACMGMMVAMHAVMGHGGKGSHR